MNKIKILLASGHEICFTNITNESLEIIYNSMLDNKQKFVEIENTQDPNKYTLIVKNQICAMEVL